MFIQKCVSKFMSTFGTLNEMQAHENLWRMAGETSNSSTQSHSHGTTRLSTEGTITNQCRHSSINIVEAWKSQWWPC